MKRVGIVLLLGIVPFAEAVLAREQRAYPTIVQQSALQSPWAAYGAQFEARLGHAVADAGDVNGDGFSDVIVSAIFYDTATAWNGGRTFVFNGSEEGLSPGADWFVDLPGHSVAAAGDLNGDGYGDVVVGSYGAGDVLPGFGSGGAFFAYYGSSGGLTSALKISGTQAGEYLGWDVGGAGDVNGDGYDDVIVGALRYDNGQGDEGRAFVHYGSLTGLTREAAWTGESDQDLGWFGTAVAGAGDVNGDGYDDIIVGSPGWSKTRRFQGAALVYYGSPNGPGESWIYAGDEDIQLIGYDVGSAGDVNGDGYSDVIVGSRKGLVAVFHGSATGLKEKPSWIVRHPESALPITGGPRRRGPEGEPIFGEAVAKAGDFNGDGFDDVLIGASNLTHGEDREGAAFLYLGSPTGLSKRPSMRVESDNVVARLAYSIGGGGDVNGDGLSDFILGAFGYTRTLRGEGAAFVVEGARVDRDVTRPAPQPLGGDN